MKRKPLLIGLGIGVLLALLLMYSLVGRLVGVYVCSLEAMLDGSHCYLVKRGESWCLVNMRGNLVDRVKSLSVEQIEVRAGWWAATNISADGYRVRAFAPYNLVDVVDLTFGSLRDLGR